MLFCVRAIHMDLDLLQKIEKLGRALSDADGILIGAGAGMSASAGYEYSGKRLAKYFPDFIGKYGFTDMYTAGFHRFETPGENWAFWSRNIYINRYMDPPGSIYDDLFALVAGRDYFVLTTNVDHCFQKAGFSKDRLFYTQGDYGLWQCFLPCHKATYDNRDAVIGMLRSQGFDFDCKGDLVPPESGLSMTVPDELLPECPKCGRPMSMNLRGDETFVQDTGWDAAAERYSRFYREHAKARMLYLEIGVGYNTPAIIKYNFWQQVYNNPLATYACLNPTEASAPAEIKERSILIKEDSSAVLVQLMTICDQA